MSSAHFRSTHVFRVVLRLINNWINCCYWCPFVIEEIHPNSECLLKHSGTRSIGANPNNVTFPQCNLPSHHGQQVTSSIFLKFIEKVHRHFFHENHGIEIECTLLFSNIPFFNACTLFLCWEN